VRGLTAQLDLARTKAEVHERRAAVDTLRLAVSRLEGEQHTKERDRLARLEGFKREVDQLEGDMATAAATIERLGHEIDKRRIRAPVVGRLGEVGTLQIGAVVCEGDTLGAILPPSALKIVAHFPPLAALGRLQPAQPARLRLTGFPWTQYGSIAEQTLALRHGDAPGVRCLTCAALTLWCLGYPAQAVQRSQEVQTLAHPFNMAVARFWAINLHYRRRGALAVQVQAEALLTLATAQGFPLFVGFGTFLRGWALAMQGQSEPGLEQMYQGLASVLAIGQPLGRPRWLVGLGGMQTSNATSGGSSSLPPGGLPCSVLWEQPIIPRLHQAESLSPWYKGAVAWRIRPFSSRNGRV
jgi:hypothetical protein